MTSATRILALRHGETDWNVEGRIQGSTDITLNEHGRWQAQQLAQALADEPIAAIYSSALRRASDTAAAIAEALDLTPRLHAGLRERAFGAFEGQTFTEVEVRWPEHAQRWRQRDPHWTPPEGESLMQLRQRVANAVDELAALHVGECVALVAHGGVLDALYRLATGQPVETPRSWELGNASINRLLWTPRGLTLVGWGDRSHLDRATLDAHRL